MDLNSINANINRLLTNIWAVISFLKEFAVDGAKDVSITYINADGSESVKTFPNISKMWETFNITNDGGVIKDLDGNPIRMVGVDNTSDNALLHSGEGRADDETGDTWIFKDDLSVIDKPWGIKHNQPDNQIEFFGSGIKKALISLSNGSFLGLNQVWGYVVFDGRDASIKSSFGISSVTKLEDGRYQINFTEATSNTNYVTLGASYDEDTSINNLGVNGDIISNKKTTSTVVRSDYGSGTLYSAHDIAVIFIGGRQ